MTKKAAVARARKKAHKKTTEVSQHDIKMINAQKPKVSCALCLRPKGMELRDKHHTCK